MFVSRAEAGCPHVSGSILILQGGNLRENLEFHENAMEAGSQMAQQALRLEESVHSQLIGTRRKRFKLTHAIPATSYGHWKVRQHGFS